MQVTPTLQSKGMLPKNTLKSLHQTTNIQKKNGSLASGFILQVGSFKTLERANSLKNNLDAKGYPAFVMAPRVSEEGAVWHRVVVGKFLEKFENQ